MCESHIKLCTVIEITIHRQIRLHTFEHKLPEQYHGRGFTVATRPQTEQRYRRRAP